MSMIDLSTNSFSNNAYQASPPTRAFQNTFASKNATNAAGFLTQSDLSNSLSNPTLQNSQIANLQADTALKNQQLFTDKIGLGANLAMSGLSLLNSFNSWKMGKENLKLQKEQQNLLKEQFHTENARYKERENERKQNNEALAKSASNYELLPTQRL
ncbi:hypothetical protein DMB95_00220 [Campylobacter sp. MIT 12-8780]|uniref:hypothetical protein n=1 Tax=unclassified Campylobacter TaxID=2593542 RepID=UPI00115F31CC|nr:MULTISPECIES: hypothetical protein [unclassified Campylobacter]NDJ26385.1 hypothetical protein [Campylobacter sp. MIT 19-121]TQR42961.1 hypothetical protein DMB95_00220 [Campylobacter sp. MIT 12-8780]